MRIVADTNTLVSGFGWGGPPARIVDAILAGRLTLILSGPLHNELARVLRYRKLAAVFADPDRILELVAAICDLVTPTEQLRVLADEPDNRVLEAAVTGQAEAIVTGDAALLALHSFRDIPILTARQLAELIDDQS